MKTLCMALIFLVLSSGATYAESNDFPVAQTFIAPNSAMVLWVKSSSQESEKREAIASSFAPTLGFSALGKRDAAKRFELRRDQVNALLNSSKRAQGASQYDDALAFVTKAKALAPNDVEVLLQQARLMLVGFDPSQKGEANTLLKVLHKLYALDKDRIETLFYLGETHRLNHAPSDAYFFYNLVLTKPVDSKQRAFHRRARYWRNQQ